MTRIGMAMVMVGWFAGVASPAVAAPLPFTEDFENVDTSYPDGWWDTSCGGGSWPSSSNPGVSTEQAFSGSRAMKWHYAGHQQHHMGVRPDNGLPEWPLSGGCSGGRYYDPTPEQWITWREYMAPGFEIDEIGTKGLQVGFLADGAWSYAWFTYMFGSRVLTFDPYIRTADGAFTTVNLGLNYEMPMGQWVCFEAHLVANTPGQANGVVELFVDEQQTASYRNLEWGLGQAYQSLLFTFVGLYVQDGMGDLYRDDLSVSLTRMGCSGDGPPSPAQPSALTLD